MYRIYEEVIYATWQEKKELQKDIVGITRQDILDKHHAIYDRLLDPHKLRQQILPMLETSGLLSQEHSRNDKRKLLIVPLHHPKKIT
jgi:hypothetical protein